MYFSDTLVPNQYYPGDKSSVTIYSITETVEANNLKVHEYVEHFLI